MNLKKKNNRRKARKGFSLVELVVVILIIAILAVAVFAGGSVVVKKSQVSRTVSDLHNFSVAVESFMNETPALANTTGTTGFKSADPAANPEEVKYVAGLNANLAEDYQLALTAITANVNENITYNPTAAANAVVYESKKTDAWGNPYYVIFDSAERHGDANSDFYITIVSAGPDAKTDLAGTIGGTNVTKADRVDDIFVLVQYMNGDVSAVTYDMAKDNTLQQATVDAGTGTYTVAGKKLVDEVATRATYNAVDGNTSVECPVNF